MSGLITRRSLVALVPAASLRAAVEQTASPEIRKYTDPVTEFPVVRLTSPAHSAWLPAYNQTAVARHSSVLLYVSDRSGSRQAWRMDHSGESRRLTDAEALDRTSVTLTSDQRSFCFVDGRSIGVHPLAAGRGRVVYRVPDSHDPAGAFSISRDASLCTLAEKSGARHRLRLIRLAGNTAQTLFESDDDIHDVIQRPGGGQLLYRSANALWIATLDGGAGRKVITGNGDIGPAYWSRDGRTILYLSLAEAQPGAIREVEPDSGRDILVARTSRFVSFSPNQDDSVFIGASASKVSPYLLLLLRSARRELTLCEHRASTPNLVNPVFSSDSQQVFFVSDREGRPAIYSMRLDRLLEKTDE
jgi:oligogalacturonide lyase